MVHGTLNNIETDFKRKEQEGVDLIGLARDRNKGNLWFEYSARGVLSS
jgi:hypothetical protein